MPPPPNLVDNPELNRWLHDLQQFISPDGGIDPSQIDGLPALEAQVIDNTNDISTLSNTVSTLSTTVAAHTISISALNGQVSALNSAVAALQANAVVRNGTTAPSNALGVNGDWFCDTTNKHIYVKVSGAYVLIV